MELNSGKGQAGNRGKSESPIDGNANRKRNALVLEILLREFWFSTFVELFVELHTFSFLFFFSLLLKIIHFSFSTLNSHGIPYSARKPIV